MESKQQDSQQESKQHHPAMWTYQVYDGYWRIYRRGVEIGTVLSELNANSIVAAANETETQLAAEREKVQTLVDALTQIKTLTLPTNECYRICEYSLAKVK